MKADFEEVNGAGLLVYGSPSNAYGKTMLGGQDVHVVNAMIANVYDGREAEDSNAAVVYLGKYRGIDVFEQKAADQIRISLDATGQAYVKLIIRKTDPGLGLLALAGGFKDSLESDEEAANREESEEAKGKIGELKSKFIIPRHPVMGDVRVWGGANRPDGVKKGDIIAMSTTAIIPVVYGAHGAVEAGDDASNAGWIALSDLRDASLFGIKGHAKMLLKAIELAELTHQLPRSFGETLVARSADIGVADSAQMLAASDLLNKKTVVKPDLRL